MAPARPGSPGGPVPGAAHPGEPFHVRTGRCRRLHRCPTVGPLRAPTRPRGTDAAGRAAAAGWAPPRPERKVPRRAPDRHPSPPRARRRPVALLATLVSALAGVGAVAAAPTASAATVDTAAWYQLVNRQSGKALDVDARSTADGAQLIQWSRIDDAANQQFQFVPTGDGAYRLKARHSGKVLDVWEWNAADGAQIRQWTDLNAQNQQFTLADSEGGRIRLVNRFSGKAVQVLDRSTADGAWIVQGTNTNSYHQQWELVKVGSGTGSGSACGGTYQAEVVQSGSTWTARRGGSEVYRGTDMRAAIQAGIDSLTPGRTSKERVVVRGSGTMSASSRISLRSYTTIEVCGTINVSGSGSGDMAVFYGRSVNDVEITRLTATGTPQFGIFIRNGVNITLGQIDLRFNKVGMGIRIDNHGDRSQRTRNVRIDSVYVEDTGAEGVETYGVDGLTIGTVTGRNTGYSALLLNDSNQVTVGTVDAQGAGTGTGYAAFRMANRNGANGGSYATNIRVGTVRASGGGRGIFCVSESGGAVIDRVEISGTGNNPILVENCYNVTIATQSGTVSGGEVRLAARTEFAGNRDITLQNLTLTNGARLRESPCTANLTIRNVTPTSAITRC